MRLRIPIRFQLLLMSTFLLAIPIIGYRYVWELETYLRMGQEQTMIGTARAVATALHEREALFNSPATQRETVRPGTDLYAVPMQQAVKLDGQFSDWQNALPLIREYDETYQIDDMIVPSGQLPSLSFKHAVGKYQQWVYAMFAVTDDYWVQRGANTLSIDQNDHLLIALSNNDASVERYAIAPRQEGWVNGFKLTNEANQYQVLGNENRIQGQWIKTPLGYNIEIRFPLSMTSGDIAFALVDVDDQISRTKIAAIGTANPNQRDTLGTIATQSTEIESLLKQLQYTDSRVWVIDKHLRVLARSGSIQSANGIRASRKSKESYKWWKKFESEYLLPIYYQVLTKPSNDFIDELENAYALQGKEIANALSGQADALWRLSPDNKAVILSASHPIYVDQKVIGAVIVEQTTNGIRTLRNQALEQLFHGMLAIMIVAILMILLFSTRISNRIRKLRDNTESVIDENGKIIGSLVPMARYDEIGDLSAAFSTVLDRLSQYNHYLENMSSRLSHELRTPVAIVRSSLENLSMASTPDLQRPFIDRALGGINRLSQILTRMSEATRLEAALADAERQTFNAVDVIKGCADSYQAIYKENPVILKTDIETLPLSGVADLFAQMLDKIVSNAIEFSEPNSPVTLHVWKESGKGMISVTNQGPLLPNNMNHELLQSMVSVRAPTIQTESSQAVHLGLGLYIARLIAEFHHSKIAIDNLPDRTGVCVIIKAHL